MPTIENALKIPGWMNPDELEWLAEQAARRKTIVEVGSWMGRSTRAMADNTEGMVLAVDTWAGSKDSDDETIHNEILKDKPEDWLLQEFLKNMQGCNNVYTYRMPSLDGAREFKDDSFDMIFLDAGHDYDSIKADILAWGPLVAEGGLLCGHDFHSGAPGVIAAVNELLEGVKVHNSIWYVS